MPTRWQQEPISKHLYCVLGTCAEMEHENIKFRLNSGREKYIAEGGKLGRKVDSVKSTEKKQEEYKQVLKELKKGTSIGEPPNCVMFQLAPFRD